MRLKGFGYNFYCEQLQLTPPNFCPSSNCSADIEINGDSKNIITVKDGGLLAKIGLEVNNDGGNSTLNLMDAEKDSIIASVEYPSLDSIDSGSYDKGNKQIKLIVSLTDGTKDEIMIDVAELVTAYQAGQGINIGDDNTISVKIDEDNNDGGALTLSDNGLGINLDGYATKDYVQEQISGITEGLECDIDILAEKLSALTPNLTYDAETGEYTYNAPASEEEANHGGVIDQVWWMASHASAEGNYVEITDRNQIAPNNTLNVKHDYETTFGKNNVSVSRGEVFYTKEDHSETALSQSNTVFSVGTGSGDDRKNAFEVRENGEVWMWVEDEYMNITDLLGQLAHEDGYTYGN